MTFSKTWNLQNSQMFKVRISTLKLYKKRSSKASSNSQETVSLNSNLINKLKVQVSSQSMAQAKSTSHSESNNCFKIISWTLKSWNSSVNTAKITWRISRFRSRSLCTGRLSNIHSLFKKIRHKLNTKNFS